VTGWRVDLLLLVTNAVYGTAYVTQREAVNTVPPGLLAFARLAIASLILLPLLRRTPGTRTQAGDGLKIFWMGTLGFGVAYVLSHFGLARSTATNGALLVTLEPVSMMLLSPFVLGERLRPREGVGAALVLLGAVLVVLNGVPGITISLLPHWRGDALIVLSALAFASYSIFGRDVLQRWDSRTVTARSILWGAVSMVPVAAVEWAAGVRPEWTPVGTAATLYLAVVVTALAYLAWNAALARVPAPRAAIFINVQPVVGVALGIWLLGEPATLYTFVGAALVLAGLAVTTINMGGLATDPPSPTSITEGLGSPPEGGSPRTATLVAPRRSRGAPRTPR
jgi:drug/metabolite transporter (DMT)-like permease